MSLRTVKVKEDTYDMLLEIKEENNFASMDDVIQYLREECLEQQIAKTRMEQENNILRQQTSEQKATLRAQRSIENDLAVLMKTFDGYVEMMGVFADHVQDHFVSLGSPKSFKSPFAYDEKNCQRLYRLSKPILSNVARELRKEELEAKQMDAAYRKGRRHVEAPGGEGATQ
ncbi:hypothetical protein EXIGUO8H_130004 [Exiguobacterium sp. 8H]|uniref:hypothetical protein n=1 Tax=unclassified Exiguobacterium TaxID=2644629 RepID=UPI0012EF7E69|nr:MULTISPECIES: hypothetical protein [unclassified Exiguobacterium]VXB38602.1 hypothetical protein EXIGUO8H_130004 [Exiguobacterium sp. 8H]VXB96528.1 hypothetical protein EXIGUO8A_340004 [Exiguobacterium sp. 8A]